jgi:hypothetical protein
MSDEYLKAPPFAVAFTLKLNSWSTDSIFGSLIESLASERAEVI